jgi:hypothetical protein
LEYSASEMNPKLRQRSCRRGADDYALPYFAKISLHASVTFFL